MRTIPLYFSFAEFKRKFSQDFEEWKKNYSDGREIDFLEEVKKEYAKYSVDREGKEWNDKIKIYKIRYLNTGEEVETEEGETYACVKPERTEDEHVGIKLLGYLLLERVRKYVEEYKRFVSDFKRNTIPILSGISGAKGDMYDIDYETVLYYMPFFSENSNDSSAFQIDKYVFPLGLFEGNYGKYIIDRIRDSEYKFENFLFSCRQIFEWIEKRKEELEPKQPLSTEKEVSKYSIIQFKGIKTEFIELINALIANGNLLEGGEREKDNAFKLLSEIFGVDTENHNQILEGFKKRNNGKETMFLDKLKKSLLEKIIK